MPQKEIAQLRKEGEIEESLLLAIHEYEAGPELPWTKNNMVWPYYYALKQYAEKGNSKKYIERFHEMVTLGLLDDNQMLNDNLCWTIFSLLNGKVKSAPNIQICMLASDLFGCVKLLKPTKPSANYSVLFKAFHKCREGWLEYMDFCDWWDFANFSEEDYLCEKMPNGKTMPVSLVEGAYIAYAKACIAAKDSVRINDFLPRMEKLNERYPNMTYTGYMIGKLMLAKGMHDSSTLHAIVLFVRKKSTEFWAWQLMADTVADEESMIACLVRASRCKTQEKFLCNIRMRLASLFAAKGLYDDARKQLDIVIKTKEREQQQPSMELRHMTEEPWFKNADAKNANFKIDYMGMTDAIIYPHVSGVVTSNKAGTTFFLKTGKDFYYIPNDLAKNIKVGEKHEAMIAESFDRKKNEWGWKCIRFVK